MPTIQTLPEEILLQVVSNLGPFDLEALTRAGSHTLRRIGLPYVDVQWIRNARTMFQLFRSGESDYSEIHLAFPGHLPPIVLDGDSWSRDHGTGESTPVISRSSLAALGLRPGPNPYLRASPPDLAYMKLNGSLDWLVPLNLDHPGFRPPRLATLPEDKVDAMLSSITELGVGIPRGFEKYMRSPDLQQNLFIWQCFTDVSRLAIVRDPRLYKCRASVDQSRGGYILHLAEDPLTAACTSIYLNKDGTSCVLSSAAEGLHRTMRSSESVSLLNDTYMKEAQLLISKNLITEQEVHVAAEEGLQIALDWNEGSLEVVGLSFEEYLATVFYEAQLTYLTSSNSLHPSASLGLRDYVRHTYRSQ